MIDVALQSLFLFFLGFALLVEGILAHTQPEKYLTWVAWRSKLRLIQYSDRSKLLYGRFVYPLAGIAIIILAFLMFFRVITP